MPTTNACIIFFLPRCPLLSPTHAQIFRADNSAFTKSFPDLFQTYLPGRMNHIVLGIAFFFLIKLSLNYDLPIINFILLKNKIS